MAAIRSAAVLGAGIMGCSTALYLARRGVRVVLFDSEAAPFSGASRWNEGKIHLGYLYSASPSLDTARRILPGGLAFKSLVEELIGQSITPVTAGEDDTYLIHRDSVVGPDVVRSYHESIAAMVRNHPAASEYLVDASSSSVESLSTAEIEALADPSMIKAGYRVRERSVSTRWIGDAFIAALEAEPRITLVMSERVTDVTSTDSGQWQVHSARGTHGPFDSVVNALWHGRPAIDRLVADCVDPQPHHRYRAAIFVRTTKALSVPSMLIAVGPFGDIKNYNGRDFYLSWYPVGMLVQGEDIMHPHAPCLDDGARDAIAEQMFGALSALMPGVACVRAHAEQVVVGGGWVYAQARGSLDDPGSSLHKRDQLGVKWFGTYVSVDTGKYSVAPYLAKSIAARITEMTL